MSLNRSDNPNKAQSYTTKCGENKGDQATDG